MPVSTRLEQEGIIIAPTLVIAAGETDQAFFASLYKKLQDPDLAQGDFKAQIAANLLGTKRFKALAALMGMAALEHSCEALQDYGQRLAQASLSDIPRGQYRFTDLLDDDGLGAVDIPVRVLIEIDKDGVRVDFEGTARQVAGNLNCPLPVTAAAVFYVFRCLMPGQVPACDGAMRTIRIVAPEGCLVNARPPAAVAAGNVETSMRIVDAMCGALAQALPGRIPAASQGSMNNLAMGARGRNSWDYYETLAGGLGAGPDCDGLSARHSHMTNTLNTPVEVLERHYPLRILRYARKRNSGGRGQFVGGDGILRDYLFLADAELSLLSERRVHAPWGLEGGNSEQPGKNMLDGEALGGKCQMRVRAGQTLSIETPGGGGYGRVTKADP